MMLPTSAFYSLAVQLLMLYIQENKLLTKLQSTEIGLCNLFVKNAVDELATVHECVSVTTTSFI